MLLPHLVFIKFNIPASPDSAWSTFLAYLRSRFVPGPHSDPISFLHLTGPGPRSPPWTAPFLRAFLQHCSAQSGTVSSYCDEDVWPLQLDRQTHEPWTVSFRGASGPRGKPRNKGRYGTQASWLTVRGSRCMQWVHTGDSALSGVCAEICLPLSLVCLSKWREWPCAVTWESLPVWWQRGHVGSEDMSCSTRFGDSCLPWGQGTEGWMRARSLGKSYRNNCCLGQNTFSDTLGGFGCRHHTLKIHENLRVFFFPHTCWGYFHMSGLILGLFIFQGWRFLVHLGLLLEIEWMIFTLAPLVQKGLPRVSRSMFGQHRQTDRQTDALKYAGSANQAII